MGITCLVTKSLHEKEEEGEVVVMNTCLSCLGRQDMVQYNVNWGEPVSSYMSLLCFVFCRSTCPPPPNYLVSWSVTRGEDEEQPSTDGSD